MPHRIFVVEDDARLSGLLVSRLREAGFTADCAADGLSAWTSIRRALPDLVLVDIELPELDGLQLCKRLKNLPETAAIGVIIASGRGDVVDRILGLELGADDYIVKPFEPREVIARINSVMRRLRQTPAPARRIGRLEIDLEAHTTRIDGEPVDLTTREFALLASLISASGRVVRRATWLKVAWGLEHGYELGARTVDVHVARLRQKLGSQADRLVTVKGVGYRFDQSEVDRSEVDRSETH
jgi:two-component system phosphate regulon response regulator PhoB